jgi:NADPH:quinone reductase-like Zn-dependent oxidoreductase
LTGRTSIGCGRRNDSAGSNSVHSLPVMGCMLSSVGSRASLEAPVRFMDAHFQPVIDSVYPFEEVGSALRHLSARGHIGKLVVRI